MSRHDHRGHLAGSVLAAVSLVVFDAAGADAQLPPPVRLAATQLLLIASAALLATSCVRAALVRWTARRDAQEAAAVAESYRLGWAAATTVDQSRQLRLVGAPHRR